MKACKCGSFAINHHCHGRDGSDDALCDVCYWRKRAEQPAQQEPEQSKIFCGVDFADGLLSVTVLRRRADDVAELLHAEQIEVPAPVAKPYEQEPVGYVAENGVVDWNICAPPIMTDLYTSPPAQRTWVGLTEDEVTICHSLAILSKKHDGTDPSFTTLLHQQIEAKLKEKNNG